MELIFAIGFAVLGMAGLLRMVWLVWDAWKKYREQERQRQALRDKAWAAPVRWRSGSTVPGGDPIWPDDVR